MDAMYPWRPTLVMGFAILQKVTRTIRRHATGMVAIAVKAHVCLRRILAVSRVLYVLTQKPVAMTPVQQAAVHSGAMDFVINGWDCCLPT